MPELPLTVHSPMKPVIMLALAWLAGSAIDPAHVLVFDADGEGERVA